MDGIPNGFMTMTNESYHSGPGYSKSDLDLVNVSLKHYWDAKINPKREPRVETEAYKLGTATHTAILEPDEFTLRYVCEDKFIEQMKDLGAIEDSAAAFKTACEVRGIAVPAKATKQTMRSAILEVDPDAPFWDRVLESTLAGRILLRQEDIDTCLAMRDAAHFHPLAGKLLKNGVAEQSIYAKDPRTGLLRKCRPDWLTKTGGILDVKTTEDASPAGFGKSSARYRYHVAGAWYPDTIELATGVKPPFFLMLAIEKSRPFNVVCYYVTEEQQRAGRIAAARNLDALHQAISTGNWPGYSDNAEALKLPNWADGMAEERGYAAA